MFRRSILMLLVILILVVGASSVNAIEVTANSQYKATKYDAKVKPYKVKADLSNIMNLKQFGKFTAEQRSLLIKNGFFAIPTDQEQLFYIYENNEYLKIPSFISSDSILEVNHLFFDYSLRKLEEYKLIDTLKKLNNNMLKSSIKQFNEAKNEEIKNASTKNVAYFSVAQKLLGGNLPKETPKEAADLANKELKLITEQSGFEYSKIFPYMLDYSQYKPRGHYSKTAELEKYFKAMMWYGQVSFPLDKEKKYKEQITQALLMANALLYSNDDSQELWEKIYKPTSIYVGESDDLNLFSIKDIMTTVFGEETSIEEYANQDKANEFYELAESLPEPKIVGKVRNIEIETGKQIRFMGQRYILDSEILQELSDIDKRPVPKGLDIAAVLGSDRAQSILTSIYKEDKKWDKYEENLNKLKEKFLQMSEDKWNSNLYNGYLWTLKSLFKVYSEGYPSFMTNTAWLDKSLNTALASWAELRHDTVLYAKQSLVAECGGGDIPPIVKGYVEPSIELYDKLIWLNNYAKENMAEIDVLSPELESKMNEYDKVLKFLLKCSVKELRNEELTREEYDQIRVYGGQLEWLTTYLRDAENWSLVPNEERNMAVIADVHTYKSAAGTTYLEEGVGNANEIYVVVPIKGKLYLTRGAIFSYYEFGSDERLTDGEWQQKIKDNKAPKQPDWTKSYFKGKVKHEIPTPIKPFASGC